MSAILPLSAALLLASSPVDLGSLESLPIPPRNSDDFEKYVPQEADAAAKPLFYVVFGASESVPLRVRDMLQAPIGTYQVGKTTYWFSASYRKPNAAEITLPSAEDARCRGRRCLVLDFYNYPMIIFQEALPVYEVLLGSIYSRSAAWRCVHELSLQETNDCEDAEVAKRTRDWRSLDTLPDQIFWEDPFDGSAFSWEIAPQFPDFERIKAYLLGLPGRKVPRDCHDARFAGIQEMVSACGVWKRLEHQGREELVYCMQQQGPDHEGVPTRCVPVLRHSSGTWYVNTLAGQIIDRDWGGGLASGCIYSAAGPAQSQLRAIRTALISLGLNVTVRQSMLGGFLINARGMNVDLSRVNRTRPWASVNVQARLSDGTPRSQRTARSLVLNASWGVSARKLMSARDAGGTDEQEDARISQWLASALERALRRTGGVSEITCEENINGLAVRQIAKTPWAPASSKAAL